MNLPIIIFSFESKPVISTQPPFIDFHYLGLINFDLCVALQRRLVYEVQDVADQSRIVCLLCEHPNTISIGRAGSRSHIRFSPQQLRSNDLELRWIGRGGACVMHTPGQLAIYPIVPLKAHQWTVGQYLSKLQRALVQVVETFGIAAETRPGRYGVWGKQGC